ncbi:MAG: hypothetical protein KKF68_02895 [Nanoarchaeota archaeon]|nr:hypothetical protein [Nanoarchaeota archaeon]
MIKSILNSKQGRINVLAIIIFLSLLVLLGVIATAENSEEPIEDTSEDTNDVSSEEPPEEPQEDTQTSEPVEENSEDLGDTSDSEEPPEEPQEENSETPEPVEEETPEENPEEIANETSSEETIITSTTSESVESNETFVSEENNSGEGDFVEEELVQEPNLEVSLSYPEKITRGEIFEVEAVIVNLGGTAKNVFAEWIFSEGFEITSGNLIEECGDLKKGEVCSFEIFVKTELSSLLGENKIKLNLNYQK